MIAIGAMMAGLINGGAGSYGYGVAGFGILVLAFVLRARSRRK
jgi:hypothetical protein